MKNMAQLADLARRAATVQVRGKVVVEWAQWICDNFQHADTERGQAAGTTPVVFDEVAARAYADFEGVPEPVLLEAIYTDDEETVAALAAAKAKDTMGPTTGGVRYGTQEEEAAGAAAPLSSAVAAPTAECGFEGLTEMVFQARSRQCSFSNVVCRMPAAQRRTLLNRRLSLCGSLRRRARRRPTKMRTCAKQATPSRTCCSYLRAGRAATSPRRAPSC